jgi:hypothetical protein
MTVRNLIKKLRKFNPEQEVFCQNANRQCNLIRMVRKFKSQNNSPKIYLYDNSGEA